MKPEFHTDKQDFLDDLAFIYYDMFQQALFYGILKDSPSSASSGYPIDKM
jgi:hypothetical protein